AMTHAMARAGADLVTLMQGVNDYFFDHLDDRNFVTALAIAMEPENGRLECINAGHPPALIINDGGIERLQVGAHYPLGIHEQQMQAEEAALPPGALLALYTDGLSELKGEAGDMLGIDGVGERVRSGTSGQTTCDQVAQSLSRAMEDFAAPGMAQDDRTFLLARRRSV
ncbi:MAG: serine/threonine-protein phosphatase, partial [Phycisphaerae bacterium]|nr:serine/threonine-protein phosphatase [Phycisphaerae bacterium]